MNALLRFRFRGRGLVFGTIMGGQFFPWIILVNPIFIIFARSGLINSQLGLILCYTAFVAPFTVYLLVGYLATVPRSLDRGRCLPALGGVAGHPADHLAAKGLYQHFGDVQTDWGAVMAGSVIATVPTLLLFLPLQKSWFRA